MINYQTWYDVSRMSYYNCETAWKNSDLRINNYVKSATQRHELARPWLMHLKPLKPKTQTTLECISQALYICNAILMQWKKILIKFKKKIYFIIFWLFNTVIQ